MTPKKVESQVERFRSAARDLGTDESEEAFDRVLKKVASASPTPMLKSDKSSTKKRQKTS